MNTQMRHLAGGEWMIDGGCWWCNPTVEVLHKGGGGVAVISGHHKPRERERPNQERSEGDREQRVRLMLGQQGGGRWRLLWWLEVAAMRLLLGAVHDREKRGRLEREWGRRHRVLVVDPVFSTHTHTCTDLILLSSLGNMSPSTLQHIPF